MMTLSELIQEARRHEFTFRNSEGKVLFELQLLWAIIITLAAPQVFVLALILLLLHVIEIEYDGRPLTPGAG